MRASAHGHGRKYETLCGLINALLLLLVGASVGVEALHRLAAPPLVHDARTRVLMGLFLKCAELSLLGVKREPRS